MNKEIIGKNFAKFLDDNNMRGGLAYFASSNNKDVAIAMQNVSDLSLIHIY